MTDLEKLQAAEEELKTAKDIHKADLIRRIQKLKRKIRASEKATAWCIDGYNQTIQPEVYMTLQSARSDIDHAGGTHHK